MTLCACGNEARYINELGEQCCAICPIRQGLDAIKLEAVPQLLKLMRKISDYEDYLTFDREVRELIGRHPGGNRT